MDARPCTEEEKCVTASRELQQIPISQSWLPSTLPSFAGPGSISVSLPPPLLNRDDHCLGPPELAVRFGLDTFTTAVVTNRRIRTNPCQRTQANTAVLYSIYFVNYFRNQYICTCKSLVIFFSFEQDHAEIQHQWEEIDVNRSRRRINKSTMRESCNGAY